MKEQTVIFMGRSGCGKGTQARKIIEVLNKKDSDRNVVYATTGALFREFISGQGYSQDLSRQIYEQSILQPTFLAVALWANQLVKEMTGNDHLIFDGAPRTQAEAELVNSALIFYKRENSKVIHLDVSRDWAVNRLTERGREDDKDMDEVDRRMDWFETDVVPAMKYLKSVGVDILEINGEQDIDKVHQDVTDSLGL